MTLKDIKDKLEIGLKPDAPYRPTNLPDSELPEDDPHGPPPDSAASHKRADDGSPGRGQAPPDRAKPR